MEIWGLRDENWSRQAHDHTRATRRAAVALASVALTLGACAQEMDGPTPEVATPTAGADLPVAPGVICRDQLTTDVTIRGEGLSPLPFDIPGAPKTALPQVDLLLARGLDGTPVALADGEAPKTFTFGGEPDHDNADHLRWLSQQEMTLVVDQSLDWSPPNVVAGADASGALTDSALLDEGLYDLRVTNANGHEVTSETALAVVDKPDLSPLAPPLTCLAQGARTIHVAGRTLLQLNGATPKVEVEGVDTPFDLESFDGCVDIAHPGLTAATCTEADWPLAQDAIAPGYPSVTLRNPATAACWSTDDVRLRVVPPPVIDEVEPSLVCTAQGDREVTVRGSGFLTVDGTLPTATLGGDAITVSAAGECDPLETQGLEVQTCSTVTVQVPQALITTPSAPELVVLNPQPAGCNQAATGELVLVPPPAIADIQPPVLCDDGTDQTLHLTGAWFLVVDDVKPAVSVDGGALDPSAVTPGDCAPLNPAAPRLNVQACQSLDVVVNPSVVDGDSATVAVTNPDPAGCSDTYDIEVPLVDPPELLDATPALVCTETGEQQIDLTGTGILRIGGALPTITVAGTPATVTDTTGCVATSIGPVTDVEQCTGLTITAPQGSLPPGGPVDVGITNPDPVACSGLADDVLVAPPAVAITQAEPASVCAASGDQTVTFTGTGFLRVDGQDATVTLAGTAFPIQSFSGCAPIDTPGGAPAVESCTSFTVQVPAGTLAEGDVAVAIDNPAGVEAATCDATITGVFFSVPVPTVASVTPADFCTDTGDTLTLTGASFTPASTVFLTDPSSPGADPLVADAVNFVSDTTLEATFGSGLPPGVYDVTVSNAVGCEDTLAAAVEIHPTPLVFFIDPPVVYSGVNIQATIYTTGLQEEAASVRLLGPNGEEQELTGSSKPGYPNRIAATIPAGLAAGAWDIQVTTAVGCVGVLEGGLTVAETPTVSVASVDPSYVWQGDPTPVTIKAADPLPTGMVGFVDTPRAYLNPNPADSGALASGLRAVLWSDASTLTGVVPPGMTPGAYDLIVVNPDATVGILVNAVHVVYDPPPVVTAVVPASFDANGPFPARMDGANFDAAGLNDGTGTVTMQCKQSTGLSAALPVTVTSATGTQIHAVFPADQVETGSVCIVTVTNGDGSSFRYSAVSTKTPAQNLNDWVAATPLVEARRALGLAAGRPTASSRYVYAIGGDDGDVANAKSSVEAAGVDLFGVMGAWSLQRNSLPAGRTFLRAARIGRFLYAVGGHDGTAATATVLRAQILDPLATPEVVDLDVKLREDGVSSLTKGVWIYRVSAVFPANDPSNPGGESLPGEPLVVQLPEVPGLELTLTWDAIPNASGYRVYRTPTAGAGVGAVELLATVDGGTNTTLVDAGAATTPGETPLPAGSTGVWHDAGVSLTVPREGQALAVARAPSSPSDYYLYAFAGRTTGGTLLSSYEFSKITIVPPAGGKNTEAQTVGAFTVGSEALGTARADLGAFVVTQADVASLADGETWIFFGPGFGAGATPTAVIGAGVVGADGDLGGLMTPNKPVGADAGYGAGDANGFLFMFGGANGAPSDSGVSARLCTGEGVGGCNPDQLPQFKNWNSLGTSMSVPRLYPGVAQESAFLFAAGGDTGNGPTTSVDTTVQ